MIDFCSFKFFNICPVVVICQIIQREENNRVRTINACIIKEADCMNTQLKVEFTSLFWLLFSLFVWICECGTFLKYQFKLYQWGQKNFWCWHGRKIDSQSFEKQINWKKSSSSWADFRDWSLFDEIWSFLFISWTDHSSLDYGAFSLLK